LPIHDVELLLQRHLRKTGLAGTQRRTGDGTSGRTDPGATAGIAVPAAATDGGAEPCSEGGGEKCSPHGLIGRSLSLGNGLRRGILLAKRLFGSESFERFIRPGSNGNCRGRGRYDACSQRDHERQSAGRSRIDVLHAVFP
jgi:hypothetical protein